MSRIKVTYVAIDKNSNEPILTAETFEDLKKGLDEYYAVERGAAKCLGWTPYVTKYPDELEGYYQYTYKSLHSDHDEELSDDTDIINVYCVNFYPETKID
jgi:hypothetical protein